jgi:cytochrome bd ubiquinol oxidase subunit II
MGLPELLAAIILGALIAYALLGGADFGGGVWDLLASGPRAAAQREAIARAIGPIWEANHVWLILVVVLLFAAFPPAFAQLMTELHLPVTGMLIGIVLRGSSFVFRAYDSQADRVQRRWGRVFAVSSALTPLLLGAIIGALTAPLPGSAAQPGFWARFVAPWLRPFPLAVGAFALAQFALLAAVYLTVETPPGALREDFRRRALAAQLAVAVLGAAVLALLRAAAPGVAASLLAPGWPWLLLAATAALALCTAALLLYRRELLARLCAAGQVTLILLGWGLSLHPDLIAGSLGIREAAAPRPVLLALLAALAAGALILFPALLYLLRIFKGGVLLGPDHGGDRKPDAP